MKNCEIIVGGTNYQFLSMMPNAIELKTLDIKKAVKVSIGFLIPTASIPQQPQMLAKLLLIPRFRLCLEVENVATFINL
jgi:hypothetical protein